MKMNTPKAYEGRGTAITDVTVCSMNDLKLLISTPLQNSSYVLKNIYNVNIFLFPVFFF